MGNGTIKSLGKFDLSSNTWRMPLSTYELGRSFALANYEVIKNNEDAGLHYIIFARGSRVEDHSKDFCTISECEANMNKIINYFKNKNSNYVVQLFLMDADAPIKEDAKYLAHYIDKLANIPTTKSINIVGISKCGAMSFYTPKYFKNSSSFNKTNIYTIATPFEGTKLASPKIIYDDISRIITSKVSNARLANLIYHKVISCYEGISSNSHMDYDIAVAGGVPADKVSFYDSSFIRNMFSRENLDSINKIRTYKNFVTGIDNKTLSEAIKTCNLTGIGLCILNDVLMDKSSDGMVPVTSQRLIDTHISDEFKSYILSSAHHDVMSNQRILKEILSIVDDTICEQNEIDSYQFKLK